MVEVAYSKFNYNVIANDFRLVATDSSLLANQLQAILWFTWKRINGILFKPQLNLFTQHDQWGLDVDPSSIRPFKILV